MSVFLFINMSIKQNKKAQVTCRTHDASATCLGYLDQAALTFIFSSFRAIAGDLSRLQCNVHHGGVLQRAYRLCNPPQALTLTHKE